ncbi:MAG: bifunctional DNA-formamidopyrimidine glycosylase/DNA-(apurinic or apyrimidinic site) lyase [Rhodospirillaceae bacterium]|nr:bifunctional DNA-formamidopyrimidine glycosylase/DNA-(apurinic or apyrimidinic site) lyase [Rhodospirillaceae bacterium]
MPELPEVETIRRGLAAALEGRRLARVVQRRADLRRPLPQGLARRLTGRRVVEVGRRGKYLLLRLDDGTTFICHLGMTGRMIVGRADGALPYGPHDHVALETEDGVLVRFNDTRRFGLMDLAAPGRLESHPLLAGLGPEPLDGAFTGPVLAAALAGRRTPIKAALLDQRVVAGLGNIYASEALFWAGLSPRRMAATVQARRAELLVAAIRKVLGEAIAAGGSSLRDYVRTDGELGYFQHRWAVYERAGQACPGCTCDPARTGGIRRIVQSGRSTFYCPRRQR